MDRRFGTALVSCLVALLAAAALAPAPAAAASLHSRRAVAGTSPAGDVQKLCHNSTPCGWAIYVPFTRRVDYFMKNTCDCPRGKTCTRTDDDLSVSAYVYRCRVVHPSTTTGPLQQGA